MSRVRQAPTNELGGGGITAPYGYITSWDPTAETRWPNSVRIYDQMRRDGHIQSVLRALTLPLRRTPKRVVGDDVRPEIVDFVTANLGLNPEGGGRRRRRDQGISWDEFEQHALLMLPFGHMFMEQVYAIGPPITPIDGLDVAANLHKLAPRLPQTIYRFHIADDGMLSAIEQYVSDSKGIWREQLIPIERLVAFVNEREGSDWTGTSVLRSAYPHWYLKQQIMRFDAMGIERNSMGIPEIEYDPEKGNATVAIDVAKKLRAGEEAGFAHETGAYRMTIHGVQGQLRDPLPSLKYHDQEIARSMLAMFLDLGHDAGARSLGTTFVDFFVLAQQSVLDFECETVTEHVIRDLVEINFGADEPYPELVADEISADSAPTVDSLAELVKVGAITPDVELESFLRERWGFPQAGGGVEPLPLVSPVVEMPRKLTAASEAPTLDELEARLLALRTGDGRPG